MGRFNKPAGGGYQAILDFNGDGAINSGDNFAQDAAAAILDANAARGILPENPLALSASLYAHTIAAGIFNEVGYIERHDASLKQAALDVEALRPFIALPYPRAHILTFYKAIGDRDGALKAARHFWDGSRSPIAAYSYAMELYESGQFAKAKQCLDERPKHEMLGDLIGALAIAELQGRDAALAELDKIEREFPRSSEEHVYQNVVWLLAGKDKKARERIKPLMPFVASNGLFAESSKEFWKTVGPYNHGDIPDEELLVKASVSRHWQNVAHVAIGLHHLADGDRKKAKESFQNAKNAKVYWLYDCFWCNLFLSRMEVKDWPLWIPKK